MLRRLALVAAAACSITPAVHANPVWRGDFESGDLSQWSEVEGLTSRLTVVPSPVRQGNYALRVELRNGDYANGGTRNELVRSEPQTEGMDRYYGWSTMFDASYPSSSTWQVFTQWHHSGLNGSPPLELDVKGEEMHLGCNTRGEIVLWKAPLVRGVWHDFVLHVRWSANPDLGFVELWYDGQKVLERTVVQTLFAGTYTYLKQGLYRDASIVPTGVVYHDGMTIGTSLADVAPQLVQAPDAGTPQPDAGTPQPDAGTPATPDPQQPITSSGLGFSNRGCTSAGSVGALVIAAFALLRPRRHRGWTSKT